MNAGTHFRTRSLTSATLRLYFTLRPSYSSMSYHNLRDEELAQRQQDLEDRVKVLIKLDAEEVACYPAGFKVRTSHAYLMGLIIPRIEVI